MVTIVVPHSAEPYTFDIAKGLKTGVIMISRRERARGFSIGETMTFALNSSRNCLPAFKLFLVNFIILLCVRFSN